MFAFRGVKVTFESSEEALMICNTVDVMCMVLLQSRYFTRSNNQCRRMSHAISFPKQMSFDHIRHQHERGNGSCFAGYCTLHSSLFTLHSSLFIPHSFYPRPIDCALPLLPNVACSRAVERFGKWPCRYKVACWLINYLRICHDRTRRL